MNNRLASCLLCLACILGGDLNAQPKERLSFLTPADSLHPGRFWTAAGAGTLIYGGFAYGLYESWYSEYELTGFHTFDDWGEWLHMDKVGHLYTTHLEANLLYSGARWAGIRPKAATWTAAAIALWLQSTVEVMDGFSAKWGFSWGDMAFNVAGAGLFVAQQYAWDEQRILMKVSSELGKSYPADPIRSTDGKFLSSPARRAAALYGTGFSEKFLKDYNAQTIWASVNIKAFAGPKSGWPDWLNLAVGYGTENMFGGFANRWREEPSGAQFILPESYDRYRQFYFSPDIDLSRIRTRSRVLRTILRSINWIKIPAPALEINGRNGLRWHWLHW